MNDPKIVMIGGGTGLPSILRSITRYPVVVSGLVTMADSGGSARVARDSWGILPPSDFWKCLVALDARRNQRGNLLRELFSLRLDSDTQHLEGMTGGTLIMTLLHRIANGDMRKAVKYAHDILLDEDQINRVIPVTYDHSDLVAVYKKKDQYGYEPATIKGEDEIDEPKYDWQINSPIVKLSLEPAVQISEDAEAALRDADLIVLGPGSLYTSVLSCLVVRGVARAIEESKAKRVILAMNLVTQRGQVPGNGAAFAHLKEVERYLPGRKVDTVLIDNFLMSAEGKEFFSSTLNNYLQEGSGPIMDDLPINSSVKVIRRTFVDRSIHEQDSADPIKRSVLRHDGDAVALALVSLL